MEHKLEKQLLNQPKEIKFCKRCVMSNQRPRIYFDSDGVCGGCRNNQFFKETVDWNKRDEDQIYVKITLLKFNELLNGKRLRHL